MLTWLIAHALEVLRRDGDVRGLALGSDVNGFAGLPPPRFGARACEDGMSDPVRRLLQKNKKQSAPVLYDVAPTTSSVRDALGKHGVPLSAPPGTADPLERYRTEAGPKGRDFDVNVEGVAHYGLLPDFLQDLVHIGVTPDELAPLFHGVEDYLQMWEQIERQAALLSRPRP